MYSGTHTSTTTEQEFADQNGTKILLTIFASLSMCGAITIIVTYFLFENLKTTPRRILVCISVGDFFTAYPYLVFTWHYDQYDYNYSRNCVFQSFVTSTAVMWSFMWTSSLAIYLYLVVVKKRLELAEKLMVFFHVINWGFPLIVLGVALIVTVSRYQIILGSLKAETSGGWCWINKQPERWKTIVWMLACGKLCEIASYFVNGILCFRTNRKIKAELAQWQHMSDESVEAGEQGQKKLALAPILYVVLRMWGTIRFFIYCSGKMPPKIIGDILLILHVIGDSSQGFVNFILFCVLTKKFRENFSRICGHRKRSTRQEHASVIANSNKRIAEYKYILNGPKQPIVFYT